MYVYNRVCVCLFINKKKWKNLMTKGKAMNMKRMWQSHSELNETDLKNRSHSFYRRWQEMKWNERRNSNRSTEHFDSKIMGG